MLFFVSSEKNRCKGVTLWNSLCPLLQLKIKVSTRSYSRAESQLHGREAATASAANGLSNEPRDQQSVDET
jgi:hypothetical protein